MPWLHVKQNYFSLHRRMPEIISKLFQRIIAVHEYFPTCSMSLKISSAGVPKLFQSYLSDNEHVGKYSTAAISPWNNFEITSGNFPGAEIKLFQMDVDEGWNNFISHVTTTLTTTCRIYAPTGHKNISFTLFSLSSKHALIKLCILHTEWSGCWFQLHRTQWGAIFDIWHSRDFDLWPFDLKI